MSVRDPEPAAKLAAGIETTLFTSSYREWRPEHGAPVVISLQTPRWLPEAKSWPKLWPATPRWSYFHASAEEYDRQFTAQLERCGVQAIARRLAEIASSGFAEPAERLVLLCWEPSEVAETQCHRRSFAAWWLLSTGEKITEITKEDQ